MEPPEISDLSDLIRKHTASKILPLSVRTGVGLDEMRRAIVARLSEKSFEAHEGVIVTNVRHRVALDRAKTAIDDAVASIQQRMEPEFIAMDLRGAADALGEITGVITSDDILDRIFSEFCIGK